VIIRGLIYNQNLRSLDWANWNYSYELVTVSKSSTKGSNLYYESLSVVDIDVSLYLKINGSFVKGYFVRNNGTFEIPKYIVYRLLLKMDMNMLSKMQCLTLIGLKVIVAFIALGYLSTVNFEQKNVA
jgi:hypothetical protein